MRQPRVLAMSWHDFDSQPDFVRAALLEELEQFFADIDIRSFQAVTGDPHPNADYEYQPLIAVVNTGNYRR